MKKFDVHTCSELQEVEKEAWDAYNQPDLTAKEYDSLYQVYIEVGECYDTACK